jgi:transcriptional regulator with XRE-family HTH domain
LPVDAGAPGDQEEPVGAALARMRRRQRLTGAKLAEMVGMSQPKISRIERGNGLLDPADVGVLAHALGADEDTTRALMRRAEQAQDRMTDWRPAVALADGQRTVAGWESSAETLRMFETAVVPGVLQTSGYAKAILRSLVRLIETGGGDPAETTVLAAVSARIQRQEIVADRSKSFRIVLTESVLKYQVCPPAEMLAQLSHLREIAGQANVEITAIPDGTPVAIPPFHGFALFDDSLVLIDLFNTGLLSRGRKDVQAYRAVFDTLQAQATVIEPLLAKYQAIYLEQLRDPSAR